MKDMNPISSDSRQSQEKNIIVKTIISIIAAGAIATLSVAAAYSVVSAFNPASDSSYSTACGDGDKGKDGGDPKITTNTCGEDKGDGGGTLFGV